MVVMRRTWLSRVLEQLEVLKPTPTCKKPRIISKYSLLGNVNGHVLTFFLDID